MRNPLHVVVIGAGWAGLAAAVELSRANIQITLIEASRQTGGRARRVEARGLTFDNGQHLMLGAYREMCHLLDIIGVKEEQAFLRRRLHLAMRSQQHGDVNLDFPNLPAPWHVIAGFMKAQGLRWAERYRALSLCTQLFLSGYQLEVDLSVAEWLHRAEQPRPLIKALWEPLCLAALNTPLQQASAEVFIHVLHEVFAGRRSDSDMLFPRSDLATVFPDPAIRYVRGQGGTVRLGERVLGLHVKEDRIHGVRTRRADLDADHVIVAASPPECLRLIMQHTRLNDIAQRLSALRYEPICTVYLQYPPDVRLGGEMMGLLDGMGQWILDLGGAGYPGRMAVVISGPGDHMALDNDDLITRITNEITRHFPQWPAPSHSYVIREKRATFSCHTGIKSLRPAVRTPVLGLWLAGDYTDTGLPATLEGALRSGVACAQQILAG